MFRYLALELCSASLYDYVEKKRRKNDEDQVEFKTSIVDIEKYFQEFFDFLEISPEEILRQSTEGLAHLHSINIGPPTSTNQSITGSSYSSS